MFLLFVGHDIEPRSLYKDATLKLNDSNVKLAREARIFVLTGVNGTARFINDQNLYLVSSDKSYFCHHFFC